MEIIQICPKLGIPSVPVNVEAAKFNIAESRKALVNVKDRWSVCVKPDCDWSYFSKHTEFRTSDLIVPLFFKDNSDAVPICYCSNLTRGEIKIAVKNGCKSIDDVQNYSNKDITGFCKERNPLGRCCRNVFLKTISDSSER